MPWGAIAGGAIGASAVGSLVSSYFNYKQQQSTLKWQKSVQNQIFQREDNAHQREVADLKAAGLNPILSAGGTGAGAGQAVQTITPQIQDPGIGEKALAAMNMLKMNQDISLSKKQMELLDAQKEREISQTALNYNQEKIQNEMLPFQQNETLANAQSRRASAGLDSTRQRRELIDAINAERSGVGSNSAWGSILRDLSGYSTPELREIYGRIAAGLLPLPYMYSPGRPSRNEIIRMPGVNKGGSTRSY